MDCLMIDSYELGISVSCFSACRTVFIRPCGFLNTYKLPHIFTNKKHVNTIAF